MTAQARDEIIEGNLDLVHYIVSRLAPELPASVDRDDLISAGIVGLIKAVDRFDPSRAVKFETYASCRIRGEVLESLRQADPVPRALRRKIRELAKTTSLLSSRLRRAPRPEETAEVMGISLTEYQNLVRQLHRTNVVSLEEAVANDPQVEVKALAADAEGRTQMTDPASAVEHQDFLSLVTQGLEQLPGREQTVLALYYGDNLTLREIGTVFEITESRVCQLHAQALRRLRAFISKELQTAA